jgi:hypothetical protein
MADMADESFLIIMLNLYPHPKGRSDARGQARLDTRSWSSILHKLDGLGTKAGQSGAGTDSLAMKGGRSGDNKKQQ